ncbi:hypothetical protein Agub_g12819 [Astrephomene gubernaculifera]|uniref:ditrans,polycis-polyprenyl diphosphate synthase [(2E,6E)-farnesyldiphosphate specific] n=1 Tax=Astrephomene gubernaculifera TaxID=47775 RepID=A0AAD3DYS2_9CHLO|nr:hypothetical protein Agub_g12819 [Astrephomene gubernaculifera]
MGNFRISLAELLIQIIAQAQSLFLWVLGFSKIEPKEVIYKGTKPSPPKAVAVVWAEAVVEDSAVKQLADILRWCNQERLEEFYIYDPLGELKARSHKLECELHNHVVSVQVGWRDEPIGSHLRCDACSSKVPTAPPPAAPAPEGAVATPAASQALEANPANPTCTTCNPRALLGAPPTTGSSRDSGRTAGAACVAATAPATADRALERPLRQHLPSVTCDGDAAEGATAAAAAKGDDGSVLSVATAAAHEGDAEGGAAAGAAAAASAAAACCQGDSSSYEVSSCTLDAGRDCACALEHAGAACRAASGSDGINTTCALSNSSGSDSSGKLLPSSSPSTPTCGGSGSESRRLNGACVLEREKGLEEGHDCGLYGCFYHPQQQQQGHGEQKQEGQVQCSRGLEDWMGARQSGQHKRHQSGRQQQPAHRGNNIITSGGSGGGSSGKTGNPPPPQEQLQQQQQRLIRVHVLAAEDAYEPVLQAIRSGGVCGGCSGLLPLQRGPYREGLARLRGQVAQLAGPAVLEQPELVLVVGPALTLAGYPPLQVAASEILHLGPAADLCEARVEAAMAKFLCTEQRFGR